MKLIISKSSSQVESLIKILSSKLTPLTKSKLSLFHHAVYGAQLSQNTVVLVYDGSRGTRIVIGVRNKERGVWVSTGDYTKLDNELGSFCGALEKLLPSQYGADKVKAAKEIVKKLEQIKKLDSSIFA